MQKTAVCLSLLFVALALSYCTPRNDFKAINDLKNNAWPIDSTQSFTFTIADAGKSYDFYYLIRNATTYPFYNLYIKRSLTDSTTKVMSKSMEELILFDANTGKPLGSGLGDIFDHKFKIESLSNYHFPRAGEYTFSVVQNMRQDPLLGVMSIGVSIEPVYSKQ
jgi:gliding motility-associated lipoprotein GldH